MNERSIRFQVPGRPRPQGSMSLNRKTHQMYPAARGLSDWKDSIAFTSIQRLTTTDVRFTEHDGLAVGLTFTYARPATHYRQQKGQRLLRDNAPMMKATVPDLDKLVRAVLDGLVLGRMFHDDKQVVSIQAEKVYGTADGVDILIRAPKWA